MIKRIFVAVLSGMLLTTAFSFQSIYGQSTQDAQVEKVRAKVAAIGTGKKARVDVKLHDDTKVKGYISDTSRDSFTVTDIKTGTSRTIAYTDVAQVKKHEDNVSAKTWGIVAGATAAGVIVTLLVLRNIASR